MTAARMEQTGVKMVVELVRAFNELTRWMGMLISTASQLLFKALKLSIPLPQAFPLTPDGHSSLSKGQDSCSSSRRPPDGHSSLSKGQDSCSSSRRPSDGC